MKGRHARKDKIYWKPAIATLLVISLILFLFFHFHDDKDQDDYLSYSSITGQIAAVGDETIRLRLNDGTEYLFSIAGVIDSNHGLLAGNQITIYYDGIPDDSKDDIQSVKVKKYIVEENSIANNDNNHINKEIATLLQNMSLEEKIAQMFLVRCPEINQSEFVRSFQPGGYLLFADDFENKSQEEVTAEINSHQSDADIAMFMAVDEEGGTVVRVSQFFRDERFQSPQLIYSQGGYQAILKDTKEKDDFLKQFGINLNMAPVCDVSLDSQDFMYARSFGKDAEATGKYVETVIKQMNKDQMGSCLKHFPGYGNNKDSHNQPVYDNREIETIKSNDWIPFQQGIENNANMIMVCHNIITSADHNSPASLSLTVHEMLRNDLSYDGIIITDDLAMESVSVLDSDENNAVKAIQAGNDMIISSDANNQYQAIYHAVKNGEISENQIDLSVLRILAYKQSLEII